MPAAPVATQKAAVPGLQSIAKMPAAAARKAYEQISDKLSLSAQADDRVFNFGSPEDIFFTLQQAAQQTPLNADGEKPTLLACYETIGVRLLLHAGERDAASLILSDMLASAAHLSIYKSEYLRTLLFLWGELIPQLHDRLIYWP